MSQVFEKNQSSLNIKNQEMPVGIEYLGTQSTLNHCGKNSRTSEPLN